MRMALSLLVLTGIVAAQRANLCFTAHAKTSLQCTMALADGPIAVYDDSESPQKARTLFSKGGKLCETKRCKRCMNPGGTWDACSKGAVLPVRIMANNADWSRAAAILFAAAMAGVPIVVFFTLRKPTAPAAAVPVDNSIGFAGSVVAWLLNFASAWWFPLVAGFGTALNMFTIVLTGATVVLFLAAVFGQPQRWKSTAIANAAGATVGTAILLLLVRERGVDYLQTTFPTVLASPAWAKATSLMTTYGLGGMLLVSSLPLILHPVIVFGILSGLSNTTILAVVFTGRTIKYLVMAYTASTAPGALRYFGIKTSLIDYATKATKGA